MIIPGPGHSRDNIISLLQAMLEQCPLPRHKKDRCGSNDCPRCEYDTWKKELEAAYKPRSEDARSFPMLDGKARQIPWALGVAIWETLYSKLYPNEQSAARIAERGGFGWEEIQMMANLAIARGLL